MQSPNEFFRNVSDWAESPIPTAAVCITASPDLIVGALCFECERFLLASCV